MGKDNVPFHTVIFPATLLGTQVRAGWLAGWLALACLPAPGACPRCLTVHCAHTCPAAAATNACRSRGR